MRLILVRHGETDSNTARALDTGHPGAPLNEKGLGQAAALVQTLADEAVEAVYSSDLTRARQTAAPLAAELGVEAVAHAGFREIFAGEHDMSLDWRPYVDMFYTWADDPTAALPGAESFVDFETRWKRGLAEVEGAGYECAVVVTHGAAMRIWVPYIASNLTAGDAAEWPLHNTAVVVLDGSSDEGWTMRSWTDADFED